MCRHLRELALAGDGIEVEWGRREVKKGTAEARRDEDWRRALRASVRSAGWRKARMAFMVGARIAPDISRAKKESKKME